MWKLFERVLRRFDSWRYQEKVKRALALHLRGEVRGDGLKIETLCHHLELRWRARDIHPWDRDLAGGGDWRPLYLEQTLKDAEAAIFRLFHTVPALDVLDVAIIDHASDNVIVAGTVDRSMLDRGRDFLSVRMRLGELGVVTHVG